MECYWVIITYKRLKFHIGIVTWSDTERYFFYIRMAFIQRFIYVREIKPEPELNLRGSALDINRV